MAKVIEEVQKPTLVISHNKTLAAQLYREFKEFFPDNAVEYFVSYYDYYQPEAYVPGRDLYIEKDASINDEIDRLRLAATTSLYSRNDVIIVATVSCIYGLGNPTDYRDMAITIEVGATIDSVALRKKLISLQYSRNDVAIERGSFRVQDEVIDIYPAYEEAIYRIVSNWDEVVTIRKLHPVSMEVLKEQEKLHIFPAKHFVTTPEQIKTASQKIKDELAQRYNELIKANDIVAAERVKSRTEYDLEMLLELGYCTGIENYSRHISGRAKGERPAVLLDYFPRNYLMFIDESHVTIPQVGGMYEGDKARKENLVQYGFRLPSAKDNRPLQFFEFESMIPQ
ncbi:uvrABC system protein B-like, partial [Ylistrum balloti]|uniref:uvrABC system protein B-like n=1 Tax=Ylistrum balloti TaxID=509963 RepID=UPI00290591F5